MENNVTLDFVVNKPAEEPRHCNSLLLFLSVPLIEIEKKVAAPDWMCFLCSYFDPAIVTEFFSYLNIQKNSSLNISLYTKSYSLKKYLNTIMKYS